MVYFLLLVITDPYICWFSCFKSSFLWIYKKFNLALQGVCLHSIQFLLVICECYRRWLEFKFKEPNFIFTFLAKSYTKFIGLNFIAKVAQKTTLFLYRHDFRTRHIKFLFFHSHSYSVICYYATPLTLQT